MKNKLISVVVIIYNIEKYLDDCIEKNQGVSEARNQGIKKHLVNIHYL